MAALPEVYRLDTIYQGMMDPDYGAVQRALPPRVPEGEEPPIMSLHEIGDYILGVSEALPKIGKQGTFGYIYGTLTHTLADIVDGKPYVSHLPRIENPDDLTVQANYFVRTWFDPVDNYAEQALAGLAGNFEVQQKLVEDIEDQWTYALEAPEVQFGEEVTQFAAGGMEEHILADLGKSLVNSKVSCAYMRRGGDYDRVNSVIRYVTTQKATELIEGRPSIVTAAVQPVATVIGGMRSIARATYYSLLQAETEEQFNAVQNRATERAVAASKMTVKYGDTAIRLFARAAGARQMAQRLGNTLPAPGSA